MYKNVLRVLVVIFSKHFNPSRLPCDQRDPEFLEIVPQALSLLNSSVFGVVGVGVKIKKVFWSKDSLGGDHRSLVWSKSAIYSKISMFYLLYFVIL